MGFGSDRVGCADGTDATARRIEYSSDSNRGGDGYSVGERTDATTRRIGWCSGGPVPVVGETVAAEVGVVAVAVVADVAEVAVSGAEPNNVFHYCNVPKHRGSSKALRWPGGSI